MATKVVLLERVEKLGSIGDIVTVKPGFARNFLLPQGKALRATNENIAYFEAQKKHFEKDNENKKKDAEALAKKLEGLKVPLVRQASEAGHMFGSVTSRDIAEAVSEGSKLSINRKMVDINRNFKMIGLFPVEVVLHPEVRVEVTINIARSPEEAEIQAKTGRALIADDSQAETKAPAKAAEEEMADANLEAVLDDEAIAIEKQKAENQAESDEKAAEKQAKKDEKKAAKAEAAPAEVAPEEEAAPEVLGE